MLSFKQSLLSSNLDMMNTCELCTYHVMPIPSHDIDDQSNLLLRHGTRIISCGAVAELTRPRQAPWQSGPPLRTITT